MAREVAKPLPGRARSTQILTDIGPGYGPTSVILGEAQRNAVVHMHGPVYYFSQQSQRFSPPIEIRGHVKIRCKHMGELRPNSY